MVKIIKKGIKVELQ